MLTTLYEKPSGDLVALLPLTVAEFRDWEPSQPAATRAWLASSGFRAEAGRWSAIPGTDGKLQRVVMIVSALDDLWAYAALPISLPPACYRLERRTESLEATRAALGWALGSYQFSRYKKSGRDLASLIWPDGADRAAVEGAATATTMVRDLINTPAADMGPQELAGAAHKLAEEFDAHFAAIVGRDLLDKNYPAVHAVGRASAREPRLIELTWGGRSDPKVTLVGKGVCFDTGGLDIKPSGGMLLMKKDMAGAAVALGLARMIMTAGLPIHLRVLIPAVENAISGNAFRPLDVIPTRKGLTVEVGNTDAEGRLILADALFEAQHQKPELIVDFATLTGAARVALGPDVPALFCNDDTLATEVLAAAEAAADPLWRLPLWQPYRKNLESKVADIGSVASSSLGGAIHAALFLQAFVDAETPWMHIDLMGWNGTAKPGRPEGGEAMAMRAVFDLLNRRYGKSSRRG